MNPGRLIDRLGLEPMEEGGWGVKLYSHRSGSQVVGQTGYRLVTSGHPVHLCKRNVDETWYRLEGDPCEQLVLLPDGNWHHFVLGGDKLVSVVSGGCWQAYRSSGYTLFAVLRLPVGGSLSLWDGSLADSWKDCPYLEAMA